MDKKLNKTKRNSWDADFKEFIRRSNMRWKQHYPLFRSNFQGDKLIGYKISKKYVQTPTIYYYFKNYKEINRDHILKIKKPQFVIKAILGHKGNTVFLICKKDNLFYDVLRDTNLGMTVEILIQYINERLNKTTEMDKRVIIEELLGNYTKTGIPPDFKVYVVMGKVRIINIYFRNNQTNTEACFTRDWNRIPLNKFYATMSNLKYKEHPIQKENFLPSFKVRNRLIKTAEKLSRVHRAMFCRYDFYCINDKIYLGEVTPVCGGLKNIPLTNLALRHLYPIRLRNKMKLFYSG